MTRRRPRRPITTLVPILLVLALVAASCVRGEQGLVATKGTITTNNLPLCPLAALDKATVGGKGPVKVELWHALAGKSKDEIEALGKAFNKSQDKVHVDVRL